MSLLANVLLKFMILWAFGEDYPLDIEHVTINIHAVNDPVTEVMIEVPDITYIGKAHEAAYMVHRGIDVDDMAYELATEHNLCFDYNATPTQQTIELLRSGPTGIRVTPIKGIVHDPNLWPRNLIQFFDAFPGPDGDQSLTGLNAFNITVPVISCQ